MVLVWLVLIVGLVAVVWHARGSTPAARILFVGNSYTFYNELPSMVVALADSAGVGMSASLIAPGGAWLADHARSPEVAAAISDGDYDVVVLQEQSMVTADPEIAHDSTYPAAAALAQMAAAAGAEVVFFQTWGHQSGNVQVGHGSFESMQEAITATYADLGHPAGRPGCAGRRGLENPLQIWLHAPSPRRRRVTSQFVRQLSGRRRDRRHDHRPGPRRTHLARPSG